MVKDVFAKIFAKKENIPYIVYFTVLFGIFLIAAIVIIAVYVPRAIESGREKVVTVYDTTLLSAFSDDEPDVPTEYIQKQRFDTRGLAISVKGKKIMLNSADIYQKYVLDVAEAKGIEDPDSDEFKAILDGKAYKNALNELDNVSVNADLSAAGEKQIEVVYKVSDYVTYRAAVPATVYFVRAVEVTSYPDVVSITDDGAELDSSFEIYATLGQKPLTDVFGEVEKDGEKGWRIKLNDTMYTQSVIEDTRLKQFYTLSFYCGNLSTEFSFYNAAGRSFIVNSTRDIVAYENSDLSGDEQLTLIVSERDKSYQQGEQGGSKGNYVYKNGAGVETVLPFAFELTATEEILKSQNIEEAHAEQAYYATVDDVEFVADEVLWQSAVVNGAIVDDHGYKVVIGSERRILRFEYGKEQFPIELLPQSFTVNASADDKLATLSCEEGGAWTLVFGAEEQVEQIASGSWEYTEDKKAVLTVNEGGDAVAVAAGEDGAKRFDVDISTMGGTFTFTVKLNIAVGADEAQATYELEFSGSVGTLPSLTLYVTEYDMNPLLGTGNGYSVGKYVFTDTNGYSSIINFRMQAWVWTFVPLSSSNGDALADASVSDYVWDGVPDGSHYNSYFRGTMYSTVSCFSRGTGFITEEFYAPESLWLNALMNM